MKMIPILLSLFSPFYLTAMQKYLKIPDDHCYEGRVLEARIEMENAILTAIHKYYLSTMKKPADPIKRERKRMKLCDSARYQQRLAKKEAFKKCVAQMRPHFNPKKHEPQIWLGQLTLADKQKLAAMLVDRDVIKRSTI